MPDVLNSDSESDQDFNQITINDHYAQAFAYRKEREELAKLKEKYGSDGEAESDSDSETEDEDGEELTPAVDAAILRTLARIRKGDPVIYDSAKSVFNEEAERTAASAPWGFKTRKDKPSQSKPVTIHQQNMQSLLEGDHADSFMVPSQPTHVEEQRALRDETINAFHRAVSDEDASDDDLGGLLTLREKSKDELEQQEEEYRAYLEREVGDVKDLVHINEGPTAIAERESSPEDKNGEALPEKKKKKKKSKQAKQLKGETDQEFLMNYILNRGWIDRESRQLPTYSEITGRASGSLTSAAALKGKEARAKDATEGNRDVEEDLPGLGELEEFEDVADVFESTYNFRFEEPGASVIQGHPRQIDSTVRREDATRKEARERRKARKAEEFARKTEEVKRLKALKMREIRDKLHLVSKEGGLAEDELRELDLDGEWDAAKHDAQMAALYGDDAPLEDDNGKPVWEDNIDLDGMPEISILDEVETSERKSKKQKKKEERRKAKAAAETEAEGAVDIHEMDADNTVLSLSGGLRDDDEWDGSEEMRKRKLNEYMEELYGLEFNDIIGGDLPTRFKYAPVEKSTYHLTPTEILMATDGELNEYMGIKKIAPYRKNKEKERWDGKRAERLREFKSKIRERAWGTGNSGILAVQDDENVPKKKRMGRKEREKVKATLGVAGDADRDVTNSVPVLSGSKRINDDVTSNSVELIDDAHRKKRRRKKTGED